MLITTSLSFSEWSSVFGDAKVTTALLDRLTHLCYVVGTVNESCRLQHRSSVAQTKIKSRDRKRKDDDGTEEEASIPLGSIMLQEYFVVFLCCGGFCPALYGFFDLADVLDEIVCSRHCGAGEIHIFGICVYSPFLHEIVH